MQKWRTFLFLPSEVWSINNNQEGKSLWYAKVLGSLIFVLREISLALLPGIWEIRETICYFFLLNSMLFLDQLGLSGNEQSKQNYNPPKTTLKKPHFINK